MWLPEPRVGRWSCPREGGSRNIYHWTCLCEGGCRNWSPDVVIGTQSWLSKLVMRRWSLEYVAEV